MLELVDANPAFDVQESEYNRLLGFPSSRDYVVTGRARELADWARRWYREHGSPWWYARQADSLALDDGGLKVEGVTFDSSRLRDVLREARAESAVLVAVSAGARCEETARRLWEEGKPDEYFFLEVFGSAVVESLVAVASFRLCEWADRHGLAVLPHYSPGYPGWDIADQEKLLDLIGRESRHGLPAEVRVLDTGMLVPKKSLLAVFGITPHVERVRRLTSLVPCANCSLPACGYRRAPYARPLRQIEAVLASPSGGGGTAETARAVRPPATPTARYSVSPAVLQRWSQERLRLTVLGDRTVDARFRYDGTTCSNLGRPLEFEYRIRLSSREEGYTITDVRCVPAPGDTGHTFMCAYLEDAESLMSTIAGEAPLLGRPLDDVVTWLRGRSPSGCFCTAESREHKWGLALQVLHFALRRDDQETT